MRLIRKRFLRTIDSLDDGLGILDPLTRLGEFGIVDLDEPIDLVFQFSHAGEHAAVERAPLKLGEPALCSIEPPRAGTCQPFSNRSAHFSM